MTVTPVHHTAATDPDGPTGRLASWVAGLTLDDIPQTVAQRAKHLLLDGLGCGLIGAQLPGRGWLPVPSSTSRTPATPQSSEPASRPAGPPRPS